MGSMRCGPRWKEIGSFLVVSFVYTLDLFNAYASVTGTEEAGSGALSSMTWTTWTADSFVKALRQSNDVQLAIDAYNDHSFYLPAKPQLLADWALNRLLKHSACIEDVKIWSLLQEILLGDSPTTPTWLPALLYKIPVVPILTSIFRLLVESPQQVLLLEHALPVLRSVLPVAYSKTRLDTILECLWACIDALSSTHLDALVSDLAFLAFDGFSLAFQTASNKGKVSFITMPGLY